MSIQNCSVILPLILPHNLEAYAPVQPVSTPLAEILMALRLALFQLSISSASLAHAPLIWLLRSI